MKSAKYKEIFEVLQQELCDWKYGVHCPFPSEAQLVRRFQVSRFTAVKAVGKLEKEGLIVRRKGKGSFPTKFARTAYGPIGLIMPGLAYGEIYAPICGEITRLCQQKGRTVLLGNNAPSIVGTNEKFCNWTTGERSWEKRHRYWNGSPEQFFAFYATAAKQLKRRFPSLKFGGPALAGRRMWAERFLEHCRTNAVPIDFFSWHKYSVDAQAFAVAARDHRRLLDSFGYAGTEGWRSSPTVRQRQNNREYAMTRKSACAIIRPCARSAYQGGKDRETWKHDCVFGDGYSP